MMRLKDILASPLAYRLWQSPFAATKIAPVLSSLGRARPVAVLDIGCGPGTDAQRFAGIRRYVGIDLSESYIKYAQAHFPGKFVVGDVTSDSLAGLGRFDVLLLNSLMHHIDDQAVGHLLSSLPRLLNHGGEIHIIDLVLPESGLERRMALADRGAFPRPLAMWEALTSKWLTVQEMRPFSVGLGPISLWEMVHIRASAEVPQSNREG